MGGEGLSWVGGLRIFCLWGKRADSLIVGELCESALEIFGRGCWCVGNLGIDFGLSWGLADVTRLLGRIRYVFRMRVLRGPVG